ncbi:MAG: Wzz/FepE/Etk N-terminal domain-containing protein [Solirubrobacteraceae bacterium]|nr:Wzz/FepE/Etk N-terminal domain-containing protein [Solirubrobacteraceae bacterium]
MSSLTEQDAAADSVPQDAWPGRAPADRAPSRGALAQLRHAVRHRRWVIAAAMIAGVCGALALALASEQRYESTATVLVAPALGGPALRADSASLQAEAAIARLPAVRGRAEDDLRQRGFTVSGLGDRVRVGTRGDNLIEIEAEAGTSASAASVANAYARAYVGVSQDAAVRRADLVLQQLERLRRQVDPGRVATLTELSRQVGQVSGARAQAGAARSIVGPAPQPGSAQPRNVARNVVIGAGLALLAGVLVAWLLERLDRRVRRVDELEEIYGMPVIARVPRSSSLSGGAGATYADAERAAASGFGREVEAFRTLRANLRYFPAGRPHGSILVASPLTGEGKSTVARVLAVVMAAMGDRVCLVDADLRKGDLSHGVRGARPEGLALVLAGFDLDEALNEVPAALEPVSMAPRVLYELPSGALPPNPAELLQSERMRWLLGELEERFDTVIIDSPAMASVSDGLALAGWVSGVLVVSSLGKTTRVAATELSQQLVLVGARPIGVVANRWRPDPEYAYDYPTPADTLAADADRARGARR